MERGYSEGMIRTQILKARVESRDSLLERGNTKTSDSKLTFNITCYPAFQNVRSILEELQILLAPDKEHEKFFPEVPIVGFRNGKSLKTPIFSKRKTERTTEAFSFILYSRLP